MPLHDIGKKALRPNQVADLIPGEHLFDVSESTNWTALHSTASVGNYELVQELISQGAVVEARSHQGQTPLHLAAYSGSLECCSFLAAAGADMNAQTFFEKNTRKFSVLHTTMSSNVFIIFTIFFYLQRFISLSKKDGELFQITL